MNVKELSSQDILKALQAWKDESNVIDHKGLLKVLRAYRNGSFSTRLPDNQTGIAGEIARALNESIELNQLLLKEFSRVGKAVSREGKLSQRVSINGATGHWAETVNAYNSTIDGMAEPVGEFGRVVAAIAKGDLTEPMALEIEGRPLKGEFLRVAKITNQMINLLNSFSSEVTRVSLEVGTDGILGGQARIRGVSGVWLELTNSVNGMADNLTGQVRNIATVATAVANGDLSQRITVEAKGEVLQLKETLNTMVERLTQFSSEVTRVARDVGTAGKLGGSADVRDVSGVWQELTNNVNGMAYNLTSQVRNIATVATAVANGDLSRKITVDAQGEMLELKDTINTMVDRLTQFSSEVTRVAREVGTDGQLGGKAKVPDVAGVWQDLTNNVNNMADNLTSQVRNIATVATAVAYGDLSRKVTVDAKGEVSELKTTINTMVDSLTQFSSEVTRVAREVGTEGKLGGKAEVRGVAGVWQDLTNNVNGMADNLTGQVRNIATVATAVANGDLSQKITVDAQGEVLELKDTINTMVDRLTQFSSEVTRVAREVGTDGQLGGQAQVPDVAGVWQDLTNNVNGMAANLTGQVRNIATVATAVANGDLSQKITVEVKGEVLELKNTLNNMVEKLKKFSSEVTRVAQEVGTDGVLGGKANVENVAGVWQELTNNVNGMADNLTNQVRNIATVATAVANGDLSQSITVEAKGEVLELKSTINTMVEKLTQFSSEVTRVAREVGTEGVLGGKANVVGVGGTWQDLTNNVNGMADNLTSQVRNIATVAKAVAEGDLSQRITVKAKGEVAELKDTINTMVEKLTQFSSEVTRVAQQVGTEGILGGKAEVKNVSGAWQDLTNNVNGMADNLTNQVRNIASVATAVANGDLGQKITVDAKGEILELKDTLNTMVDRLTQFASEVTRVAQEVGTDGILGGQAEVAGVTGAWGDLTRNVNRLANNLTDQVRDISRVTSAVAKGDLEQKITVEAQGEVLELKNTINSMTDTLSLFANQVTYVAKEVGDEGKLGGQADVPEAQGIWRNLTDNVNELADNLTRQIRAILTVVTDVTQGNLTGSIDVAAKGEVETLKNGLNQMILTLKETSDINNEQDWLKSNLSYFVRLMQGNSNLQALADVVITKVCTVLNVQHGVFYALESNFNKDIDKPMLYMLASYAFHERKSVANRFEIGQGLVGQAALEKKRILVHNIPGDYIQVSSGLGNAQPLTVVVLPVVFENELLGVLELGSFSPFTEISLNFLDQLMESLGIVANAVVASAQTESLLTESQSLSEELQKQQEELKNSNVKLETQAKNLQDSEAKLKNKQEELQQTNEELEEKSRVLADQKHEVESAKIQLEEKAQQLAISSKYKSEFLANMSHELRTPLNSLMVLSDGLRKNIDKNFTDKQVEKMATIHDSGIELLELINEILDLAKIEAGKMLVQVGDIFLQRIQNWAARGFNQMAENKGITFETELDPSLPKTILTDEKRLQQVIKNFISNAIKFTNKGQVTLSIYHAKTGWTQNNRHLNEASTVVAFSVTDSGIGIPADKHQVIFEAFQQADGSTSRKYGGTGLGLSISREIAHLLAGEIILESGVGKGSSFTLFIPHTYPEQADDDGNSRLLDYSGSNVKISSLKDRSKINISPAYISDVKQLKVSLIGELAREVEDDRIAITASDRVVLIIENDLKFAKILLNKARKSGFKGIVATTGDSGLLCAQEYCPDAILLDIKLPIMNGWIVLDRIKHDAKIRHIPVHILSVDDVSQRSLEQGAISFLQKPIDDDSLKGIFVQIDVFQKQKVKQLLVVADNEKHRLAIVNLVDNGVVNVTAVATAKEAIKELKSSLFQCMVLALILPDENGLSLIESINKDPALINLPIIIYKGKDLTEEEEYRLNSVAETIMVKNVKSPERLIDETALFLHIVESNLPESKRQMLQQVHENDPQLWGRTILIVDDDVRNIFTLTSVFEAHDCVTLYAESGREAIEKLKNHPEIEIILMDIMMPVMNGYQTMQAIRKMEKYQSLPIIAVTAKAMMEDRQKCLDAGASDYIVKPVDTELLLSLVRVWLYK
jgi:HAMP domain-containing protein/signal transduction histidine kinase/CheY-like chemotaxis protein